MSPFIIISAVSLYACMPPKNIGHPVLIPHDTKRSVLTNPKQKQFCDDIVVTFSMPVCVVTL